MLCRLYSSITTSTPNVISSGLGHNSKVLSAERLYWYKCVRLSPLLAFECTLNHCTFISFHFISVSEISGESEFPGGIYCGEHDAENNHCCHIFSVSVL